MEQIVQEQLGQDRQSSFMKVVTQISRGMAGVGAVSFAAMMIITVIDVGGRNLFLIPLNGAVEMVGLLLVIGGTWGMGYCQLLKMHIRINIITEKLPPKWKTLSWIVTCLVSLIVSVLIAWRAYFKVNQYLGATLGSTTDVLGLPYWPFVGLMAFGFTWVSFLFIVDIVRSFIEVVRR